MKTRLLLAVWIGIGAIQISGQAGLPPPADHYEVGVFQEPPLATQASTPFSRTVITNNLVKCGYPFGPDDPPPDDIANPTVLLWDDPASGTPATKFCKVSAPTIVLSLPLGVNYRAGIRAVAADGTVSAWGFSLNLFRRASRGFPCPNGPGVQFIGENDIDGKPVRVTICVQTTAP
jgi:hypothetical protein